MSVVPSNVTAFAIPWPHGEVVGLLGTEGAMSRVAAFLSDRASEMRSVNGSVAGWRGVARETFRDKSLLVSRITTAMASTLGEAASNVSSLATDLSGAQRRVSALADEVCERYRAMQRAQSIAHQDAAEATSLYWLSVESDDDTYDAAYSRARSEARASASAAAVAESLYRAELDSARRQAQIEVDHIGDVDRRTAAVLGQADILLPGAVRRYSWLTISGPGAAFDALERSGKDDAARLDQLLDRDSLTEAEYRKLVALLESAALASAMSAGYSEDFYVTLGPEGVARVIEQLAVLADIQNRFEYGDVSLGDDLFASLTVPLGHALAPALDDSDIDDLIYEHPYVVPLLLASGALDSERTAHAAAGLLVVPDGPRDHFPMYNFSVLLGPLFDWNSVYSDVAVAALVKDPSAAVIALGLERDGTRVDDMLLSSMFDLEYGPYTVADVYTVAVTHQMANGDEIAAATNMERLLHEILPGGNDAPDELLVELAATLLALFWMSDLHASARIDLTGESYGDQDGVITRADADGLWLSTAQLEELFQLIIPDDDARQVFLLGVAEHQASAMDAGIASGDSDWVFEVGSFDQLWINGHDRAAFADQTAQQKALDDAQAVFDIVIGLVPGPSFGSTYLAKIAAGAFGEARGLLEDEVKSTFGSVPSDVDVALGNRDFSRQLRLQASYTVVQGLIDAGVVEMLPDHLVTTAYDMSYGTPIPMGRKLLSIDVLREHPQLMLELDSWINEQRVDVPQLDQTLQWLAEVWSLEDLDL